MNPYIIPPVKNIYVIVNIPYMYGICTSAPVVVSCTTGQYLDIALAVALIYVIGGIQF